MSTSRGDDDACSVGSIGESDAASKAPSSEGHHAAPLPSNEAERVEFLRQLQILDSVEEEAFDRITKMLAKVFNAPIALVSLVDSGRQWFKSCVGLQVKETPREQSMCAWLLLPDEPEIFIVQDATLDPRFNKNPLVTGEPHIRFYCGAPIIVKGVRLGSVCVIDSKPRTTLDQCGAFLLANFADTVASLIARRKEPWVDSDMIDHPSFLVEVSAEGLPILYANERGNALFGDDLGLQETVPKLNDLITIQDSVAEAGTAAVAVNKPRVHTASFKGLRGEVPCICYFHPTSEQVLAKGRSSSIACPWNLPLRVGKEYNFVVIKLENKSQAAKLTAAVSTVEHVVLPIHTTRELYEASVKGPCVVLYTSRFCSSCVLFADFYKKTARMNDESGVKFYQVCVDDAVDIVRVFCGGALFIPMVQFRTGQNVVQANTGSWSQFRLDLAAFIQSRQPQAAGTRSTDADKGISYCQVDLENEGKMGDQGGDQVCQPQKGRPSMPASEGPAPQFSPPPRHEKHEGEAKEPLVPTGPGTKSPSPNDAPYVLAEAEACEFAVLCVPKTPSGVPIKPVLLTSGVSDIPEGFEGLIEVQGAWEEIPEQGGPQVSVQLLVLIGRTCLCGDGGGGVLTFLSDRVFGLGKGTLMIDAGDGVASLSRVDESGSTVRFQRFALPTPPKVEKLRGRWVLCSGNTAGTEWLSRICIKGRVWWSSSVGYGGLLEVDPDGGIHVGDWDVALSGQSVLRLRNQSGQLLLYQYGGFIRSPWQRAIVESELLSQR